MSAGIAVKSPSVGVCWREDENVFVEHVKQEVLAAK